MVILDARTGAVRAMAGSRDYAGTEGQINGATIFRSGGSTLKPFLYLGAIDQRELTAATVLPDTPDAVRTEYVDYDPVNYDRRFWGPVRGREALANSLNVPAVVALSQVGARQAFARLQECGLRFARPFGDYGAGLILGNAEVRLLDLVAAYTAFAGGGLAVEPRLLQATPVRHRYLASPEAVALVADILSDDSARRKTFGAFSPLAFAEARIPVKTGTSSAFRDAWAIGVTREHAVGVWVGNFNGRPMQEVAAIRGAAPLWRELIDHLLAHGDTPPPSLVESGLLVRRGVCELTGLLPVPASPAVVQEWFLADTTPTTNAAAHFREVGGAPRLVLPERYAQWCRSSQNHLRAVLAHDTQLRIVSPAPGSTFLIDPHLPRAQQALRLVAAGAAGGALRWRVNGAEVARSDGGHFWPLAPGRHVVEAASDTERAIAEFIVE